MSDIRPDEQRDLASQIAELQPRLLRFAWSMTHDSSSAEDLAQETIARALASQWRFQPGTNLKAWLFRILRNLHLNALRASHSRPDLVPIDKGDLGPFFESKQHLDPVETQVVARAELTRIVEAYRMLPPAFGIPLYLTAVEELSYAEVASILGVPVGTVMSRVYRARRILIPTLSDDR